MKLFKLIAIIFIVYFIRRFFQMYQTMKRIQEAQANIPSSPPASENRDQKETVNADFKILD